jgi:hypothetical protein
MTDEDAIAEMRRHALKEALDARGMTPTDLARKCGWAHPTKIYNFMNGISASLTTATYQQILAQMPGLTMEDLLGDKKGRKTGAPVLLRTYVQGHHLRESFNLPANQIRELPLPVDDSARQAGAFAAMVRRPGAEEIYPEKTLLLVEPIARYKGIIIKGRRLLVERLVDTRIEVTVREVQEDAEGRLWLSQRSTDPRLQGAVKLPQDISGRVWQSGGERYVIAGVVIGAFIPEG